MGDPLPDVPLCLEPDLYGHVPLEATYRQAWDRVPGLFREAPEARPG